MDTMTLQLGILVLLVCIACTCINHMCLEADAALIDHIRSTTTAVRTCKATELEDLIEPHCCRIAYSSNTALIVEVFDEYHMLMATTLLKNNGAQYSIELDTSHGLFLRVNFT
jgi:hypothetical protein